MNHRHKQRCQKLSSKHMEVKSSVWNLLISFNASHLRVPVKQVNFSIFLLLYIHYSKFLCSLWALYSSSFTQLLERKADDDWQPGESPLIDKMSHLTQVSIGFDLLPVQMCVCVCVCAHTCECLSGKRLQLHFNVQQMCRVKWEESAGGFFSTELSRWAAYSSAPPNSLTFNHPATNRLSNTSGNTRSSSSHTYRALLRLKPAEHSSLAPLVFTDRPACWWSINAAEVKGRISEAVLIPGVSH